MKELVPVFRCQIVSINGFAGLDDGNAVWACDLALAFAYAVRAWMNGCTAEGKTLNAIAMRPDPGCAMHIGDALEEGMSHLLSNLT